jgi:tRNA pseudouridine38-40 synthase
VWQPGGLDVPAMREAGALLVGEHDFAAFAAAGHGRLTTVRRIDALSVRDISGEDEPAGTRIRMDVSGSGFLWNMVRIIAGTLLQAGTGRMTAARVGEALASGDRRLAGPTLGPEGLCLEWIRYGPEAGGV